MRIFFFFMIFMINMMFMINEKIINNVINEILHEAFEGGINALDTAPEYGCSEEVIGRALKELGLSDRYEMIIVVQDIDTAVGCSVAWRKKEAGPLKRCCLTVAHLPLA